MKQKRGEKGESERRWKEDQERQRMEVEGKETRMEGGTATGEGRQVGWLNPHTPHTDPAASC